MTAHWHMREGHCAHSNITIEDPTARTVDVCDNGQRSCKPKHLRHAAFFGVKDSVHGSSASVLTGGSVSFGTNGFMLLLNNERGSNRFKRWNLESDTFLPNPIANLAAEK